MQGARKALPVRSEALLCGNGAAGQTLLGGWPGPPVTHTGRCGLCRQVWCQLVHRERVWGCSVRVQAHTADTRPPRRGWTVFEISPLAVQIIQLNAR